MGPYPHDAPPATISDDNPMGTDGFEFVEYASTEPEKLCRLFETMGFAAVARHRSKDVTLYRQGDVNFVVNAEPDSFARRFAELHGPCACAMAFRVVDAGHAFERAVALGAKPVETKVGPMELNIPAVEGIGGSLLYFVDRYGEKGSIWDVDFRWTGEPDPKPEGAGLFYIDHLTHNVYRGNMEKWADWYARLFNFRPIRYFNIEGKLTGLSSKAMCSPCARIRIPINESADEKSQIEEYLRDYQGEGIQHVACGCHDIYAQRADPARARRRVHAAAARGLLREGRHAPAGSWRAARPPADLRHPDRRRGRGRRRLHESAAADLLENRDRPDLLRVHPAQGRRGFWRGQFPGAVREHRGGPDPPRRAEGQRRLSEDRPGRSS